jgi:hypothetical protein
MTVSSDKDVIFHGINYPYQHWDTYMKPVTSLVIKAAGQNRATILFPGNIYAFGNIDKPIREETLPNPSTKKGILRDELETMLKEAADSGTCRIINLRMPDFWGPNVTNGLIKPLFGNAAAGKPMQWMIRADIPHQFVYTPDAAKLFFMLSNESGIGSCSIPAAAAKGNESAAQGMVAMMGARMASGCPSGHGLSGMMQLSVSGFVAMGMFFMVGILVAALVYGRRSS